MKKYIALILAAVLVCGLFAGCDSARPGGSVTPLSTGEQTDPQESTQGDVADKDVSLGAMEGGVYTNEYTGFGCKLDENWTFATAEQLQQMPENVDELFADSELADSVNPLTQFFDMQAENVTDMTSINVLYQKLAMNQRLAYALLTEEQIIDETLKQQDTMISSYASAGITVSKIEKVKVTFLGKERHALMTTAAIGDMPYYTLQLFDFQLGQYSVTTTLASYGENNTEALLALFYTVA